MSMFKWEVVDPAPGQAVLPMQRLPWGKTIGLGAQHVVAMFGATFVFPLVMGLDANLAIMFSGFCTILFLLIVQNRVPSYLGTSASFVASVAAIRALDEGNDSSYVTGAILVGGLVLAAVGVLIHFAGAELIHRILPPAVTGAVVMLIGVNLAPVVAGIYWPQDQWVALATAAFMVFAAVALPGFWSRIAVFLALVFGYLLSWILDVVFGPITSVLGGATEATEHDRVSWAGVQAADWIGLPSGTLADGVSVVHGPSFSLTAILLVLPGVIALVAENTGHVKAVAEMTGEDLDPYMGRAIGADVERAQDRAGTTMADHHQRSAFGPAHEARQPVAGRLDPFAVATVSRPSGEEVGRFADQRVALRQRCETMLLPRSATDFLQSLAEQHCACGLDALFDEWVYP